MIYGDWNAQMSIASSVFINVQARSPASRGGAKIGYAGEGAFYGFMHPKISVTTSKFSNVSSQVTMPGVQTTVLSAVLR